MERLNERLATAQRAVSSLLEVLAIGQPSRIERDAAIQRFEYTCEAVWKTAQRYLQDVEGISVGSPKGCLRTSREVGLLTDEQTTLGLEMVDDRNRTVHTYNEAVADEIYAGLAAYARLLDTWLSAIMQRAQP